ncbi:MAG: helix-turn-helix domain-containing protein, partial [Planctomycetes bacterium]|nr:helix-turn-helix domain-containing protein [Planctomycetota bacterium]
MRAVRAVFHGRSMSDVADAYGTNRSTISRWVKH